MKKVKVVIEKDGRIKLDFDGFVGRRCQQEEDLIRLILEKGGVLTDVQFSDNKREAEANGTAEREKT